MTRLLLIFGMLLSSICILFGNPVWAANIYWASVSGSNTPICANIKSIGTADAPGTDPGSYGSINGAANCATVAGDVVNVKPGTYSGGEHRIALNGQTTGLASGTSAIPTYIQGHPGGAKPVLNLFNWFTMKDNASSSTRSYIYIRNFFIDGTGGTDSGGGELLIEGDHITVDNVEITHSINASIAAFGSTSLIHHLTVKNSRLHDYGEDGNGTGAYLNANDVLIEHNEIYSGKGQTGIQVAVFESVAAGLRSDNPIIRYNYLHDQQISTDPGHSGCGAIAVDGINAQIYNNIIVNPAAGCVAGISAGYETQNNLKAWNNTISGFNIGIYVGIFANTVNNEVKNNLLAGNSTPISLQGTSTYAWNGLQTNRTTGAMTDCTVSAIDFHQKAGSPCIDTGTNLSASGVTSDYYGTSRPQGSAFDIGAHEFGANQSDQPPSPPANLIVH